MALVKDEWVIRKTSDIDIPSVNSYVRGQLDDKQDDDVNLNLSGGYVDNFFADVFDARDGSLYRIYATGATNNSSVIAGDASNGTDGYYAVVKATAYITQADLEPFVEQSDLSEYRVEDEIVQIVDNKIDAIQIDEVIIG